MNPTRIGILAATAAIIISPLFTAPGYSLLRHSVSELGAQCAPNAWIMNLGFVVFGLGVFADAAKRIRDVPAGAISFMVFGASMALAGIISHRPIDRALSYDVLQDQLHSALAAGVGVGFAVGTLCFAFAVSGRSARIACGMASASALAIPAGMNLLPDIAGVLQRVMFVISFGWLAVFLPGRAASEAAEG